MRDSIYSRRFIQFDIPVSRLFHTHAQRGEKRLIIGCSRRVCARACPFRRAARMMYREINSAYITSR